MRLMLIARSFVLAPILAPILFATGLAAQGLTTSAGEVAITNLADELTEPWAIGVLPDGSFLVTERGGRLTYHRGGKVVAVDGAPPVAARGQGGLLDVTIARDFNQSRTLFLTYSHPQPGGASTAMARATLSADGTRLDDLKRLFVASPVTSSSRHFGSRVVEAPDGTLFVTLGERGDKPSSQDLSLHNGSIVRVNRDGSVPRDNPFVNQPDAQPQIWSYGHRNIQGAGLDLNGDLVATEHGAKGGDEVNRIRKGANYGWPVISYGVNYNGSKIGQGTAKAAMEQPEFYWDPSIAPSGLLVYSGKLWPDWAGNIFIGSLKFNYISRLSGDPLAEAEQLKNPATARVRDVIEAPDGSIWFLSVARGAVYRIAPP